VNIKKLLSWVSPTFVVALVVGNIGCNSNVIGDGKGAFVTDSRNGQTYRTIQIGQQRWMAENLNYKTDSSWCYENTDSNCAKYGRLYNWDAAMVACPDGWRLPGHVELRDLSYVMGNRRIVGKKLKSKAGWCDNNGKSGNGVDKLGFSAMPGGNRYPNGRFFNVGHHGFWWSATEQWDHAYYQNMSYDYNYAHYDHNRKTYGFSVRCVKAVNDDYWEPKP
jgi:uncharacterized protein (TIGR02145 family)